MITISWQSSETLPRDDQDGGDSLVTSASTLVLDIVTSQQRDIAVSLPEHPVEEGAAVGDHVVPQPRTASFEAVVSDAHSSELIVTGVRRRQTELFVGQKASIIGSDDPVTRTTDILEQLATLAESGTEIDVSGLPFGDLEGYQIESISVPHDTTMGRSTLSATISVKKRRTVSVSEVEAPAPLVERARPNRNTGAQTTTPQGQNPTTDSRAQASRLYNLVYGGAGS